MFDGITFKESATVAAVGVFLLSLGTFIFICFRTLLTPQKKIDQMANLPLEDDPHPKS